MTWTVLHTPADEPDQVVEHRHDHPFDAGEHARRLADQAGGEASVHRPDGTKVATYTAQPKPPTGAVSQPAPATPGDHPSG